MQPEIVETPQYRTTPRFKLVPAVYMLLKNERGEVLLALRKNTGYADGFWAIPAGHLDGDETARQGLKREAKEELGIDVAIEDMKVALVMHRLSATRECIDIFIEIAKWQGEIVNNEPDRCAELRFFPSDKLPETLIPYEQRAFAALRDGETYCEFGWTPAEFGP